MSESSDDTLGNIRVRRAWPRRGRRTVRAWCFADRMELADITENSGLDVGRHSDIGLQTVTWLTDGQVLHRDGLGSEQVIGPEQLNLMTSGNAVSHTEEATGHHHDTLEGIQLWAALPEATRRAGAAVEHLGYLSQGRDEFPLDVRDIDNAYASWTAQDDRCGRVLPTLRLIPAQAPSWHNLQS
ncbi:pirin family protein [[Kitasatospora] papulosa]|uniref:pirin family protein n=1 Tax=[Kitasatospora] papulosa TaxID=1464011 RepID=UPI00368D7D82